MEQFQSLLSIYEIYLKYAKTSDCGNVVLENQQKKFHFILFWSKGARRLIECTAKIKTKLLTSHKI